MIGSRCGVLLSAVLVGAVVVIARPAAAQEVSAGYQFERISGEGLEGVNLPLGIAFDISAPISGPIEVVGAFDWSHRSDSSPGGSAQTTANYYSFSGGVRVEGTTASGVRPFAQGLFGATRISGSTTLNGNEISSNATTRPMFDLGGGAALPLGGATSVFGEVDYRRIFTEGIRLNGVRLVAGVRFAVALR